MMADAVAMRDGGSYDAAVIGAGPAGAAVAIRLARSGCRVLLVERSGFDAPRVGETLMPSVQPLLADLGVWDRFGALEPLPSWGTRSVWGAPEALEHSHIVSPYGCGWHVDRQQFDRMLADTAVDAGASLWTKTRMVQCERQAERWSLTLANGERTSAVTAGVIVDASGRGARLAHRLGARRLVFDRLVGVMVQFAPPPGDREYFTLIETAAEGWWYSAPVGTDRLIVMLMTDSDLCAADKLFQLEHWMGRVRQTSATLSRIANAPAIWGPRVFSAVSQRLSRDDFRSRWVAVGDAALAVDPVSGSGVVRALRTAASGALGAVAMLDDTSAIADVIREYEDDRDEECVQYLQDRDTYYSIERRWPESPFWKRRVCAVSESFA